MGDKYRIIAVNTLTKKVGRAEGKDYIKTKNKAIQIAKGIKNEN